MAQKQTTQDQDSIREERVYNRELTRIESYENSSKNRARRRVLDGIGKIVTGRRREGVREIREAARQRTEESVRNRVMGATNEAIHQAEKQRQGLPGDTTRTENGQQIPPQNREEQTNGTPRQMDTSRQIPERREGANGMTVEQLTQLNELKKSNPQKYKEEMQRIFGTSPAAGKGTGEQVKLTNNEKHGLKL